MMQKRNNTLRLLSVFVSLLLPLLIYEVVENAKYKKWKATYSEKGDLYDHLAVASSNMTLIWEYRSHGECQSKVKEVNGRITGVIRTNRFGFRDVEYDSVSTEDGSTRIAYIGDSVTLGLWVDFDSIFVRRFEAEAGSMIPNRCIRAFNFGIDGYHTVQIHEMLRSRVLQTMPDKVVYMLCLNDFDFKEASRLKMRFFKKPVSFLSERIERALYMIRRAKEPDYHVYHFQRNKDIVFEEIQKMDDLLESNRIDFQVAIMPVFEMDRPSFDDYPLIWIHEEIQQVFKTQRIDFIDLLDNFKLQDHAPEYFAFDVWHPNETGHRFIAKALVRSVLEM